MTNNRFHILVTKWRIQSLMAKGRFQSLVFNGRRKNIPLTSSFNFSPKKISPSKDFLVISSFYFNLFWSSFYTHVIYLYGLLYLHYNIKIWTWLFNLNCSPFPFKFCASLHFVPWFFNIKLWRTTCPPCKNLKLHK